MLDKGTLKNISTVNNNGAKEVYQQLMASPGSSAARAAARDFLELQLGRAAELSQQIPDNPALLSSWLEDNLAEVGSAYADYLDSRKRGEPRRYFRCRSQALSFLQGVAPTKLVDGAWLYGCLKHWSDPRFQPLIRTYLEELGDGDPATNHVALYQRLLVEHDCEELPPLSDEHFVQGALQLALACHADDFMPEVIGYNLGYEQLPLHLLISAFELGELGIDPYYFTLHVTIDNGSSGHARKALLSVKNCLPLAGSAAGFMQRVADGYRLNYLGLGTLDVIGGFDLEQELVSALERKCRFGQHLHSDFCRIDGRSVNEWLSTPGQMRLFLKTLENKGWIQRNEDVNNSRFWQLLEGPRAQMAGVFSRYEKQLLRDWITGATNENTSATHLALHTSSGRTSVHSPFHRNRRLLTPRPNLQDLNGTTGDLDQDVVDLKDELRRLPEASKIQRLIELMAPPYHATAAGLFATREFSRLIG